MLSEYYHRLFGMRLSGFVAVEKRENAVLVRSSRLGVICVRKLVRKLSQISQGNTYDGDLFMAKGKVAVQHLTCSFAQLFNQLGPRPI